METTGLRQQLESLSIPKDRRPRGASASRTAGGWGVRIVLLATLAAGGYWAYTNREKLASLAPAVSERARDAISGAPAVVTTTIRAQRPQDAPAVLTATGKIVSDHLVQVQTKVSGQIVELRFEQGDRVERGQVLARIEDVNYRARRDEAAAMVEKSKANLKYQQFEFDRISNLMTDKRATDKEMAIAESNLEAMRAQLAGDEAALEWATKAYRDTEVVAPIAGVVLERNVEVGDFVAAEGGRGANANAQFASIADMGKLRVEIDISEIDIARVRPQMPCIVIPDAYKDRKYYGHVMWIDPGANYAKATVQAKVRIEQPDDFLRVEGAAQVQFLSEDPRRASADAAVPVIWIPQSAVRTTAGDAAAATVFLVESEKIRAATVKLGRSQGGQVEILDGLTDGQSIVTQDIDKLSDGMRVK